MYEYRKKYLINWRLLNMVLSGESSLDSDFFVGENVGRDTVDKFVNSYGLDYNDPIVRAELFGHFQEALQFIRKYFLSTDILKEHELTIPGSVLMITDIDDLFLMATGNLEDSDIIDKHWAESILKVMHTILHVDKDLHSNYFRTIQTQIFDRFYKYIYRDSEGALFLGEKSEEENSIQLVDFETKAKKTRDSVILKLLHKAENVAEELFDKIGIRFVTNTKFDTLLVIKFLLQKFVVIPHNIKPSRSVNNLIDLKLLKVDYKKLLNKSFKDDLTEEEFLIEIENILNTDGKDLLYERNKHSLSKYKSIQFTCRQLITYKNQFVQELKELRVLAKKTNQDENVILSDSGKSLMNKIMELDFSLVSADKKFFFPYEVQIIDKKTFKENSTGDASHKKYKKQQVNTAMKRVLKNVLIELNINVE